MTASKARRVMLLAASRAYRTDDFVAAAEALGIELVLGSDRCHVLAETWTEGALALEFGDPAVAAVEVAAEGRVRPLAGIVATDERTAAIAARAAALLGLPGNAPNAAALTGNKRGFRRALAAAGMEQPAFVTLPRDLPLDQLADAVASLTFPVVIKPLHLSASRGVMRADDVDRLHVCWARLLAILRDPEVAALDRDAADQVLVESFVPGCEVAFEGMLDRGELHPLAIFDKPDPLDGPFFAETLYVTPSAESEPVQRAIVAAVEAAARAIGLEHGPVHAELRLREGGADEDDAEEGAVTPVVLELAARSIGGLCGRIFQFSTGIALERLILEHAARTGGEGEIAATAARIRDRLRARGASGVLMMPVPRRGVLRQVHGLEAARAIPGVVEVEITARVGEDVVPLPEGSAYLGFAFALARKRDEVIAALHAVQGALDLEVAQLL